MRVAVVIPALNEAQSLPLVLRDLPRGVRVVVVDNGSTDGTAEVARASGAEVVDEPRRGYGQACLAGIAHLASDPPDVVAFVDADYSDYPAELAEIVLPIERGEADFVIGSRVLDRAHARDRGRRPRWARIFPTVGFLRDVFRDTALTPQQRFGNALACALVRAIYGQRFTDLGPFRALRWEALRSLRMSDTNYGWTVEMMVKAVRRGLRVVEVPVRYRQRIGRSKISGTVLGSVRAGYKILFTVFRHAWVR